MCAHWRVNLCSTWGKRVACQRKRVILVPQTNQNCTCFSSVLFWFFVVVVALLFFHFRSNGTRFIILIVFMKIFESIHSSTMSVCLFCFFCWQSCLVNLNFSIEFGSHFIVLLKKILNEKKERGVEFIQNLQNESY